MMTFKTKVTVDITGNGVEKSGGGEAEIEWGMELETRSWGIKGFQVFVPDQTVSFIVTRYNELEDEEYEEELTLDIKNATAQIVEGRLDIMELCPIRLEKYYNKFELLFY